MTTLKDLINLVSKSYRIKRRTWKNSPYSIVMEPDGDEFPLLGLVNLLALRGSLSLPVDAASISPAKLTVLLAAAFLSSGPCSDQTLDIIVGLLQKEPTQVLLDVKFSGVREFVCSPETELLKLVCVPLYHAWVVDPTLAAFKAIIGDASHDQITTKIGRDKKEESVGPAVWWNKATEKFLEMATEGMTRYGLEELEKHMEDGEVGVLWKKNKLVTVYKVGRVVYQLVTMEREMGVKENLSEAAWKTLSVDGQSVFVDENFSDIRRSEEAVTAAYVEAGSMKDNEGEEEHGEKYKEKVIGNVKKLLLQHPEGLDRSKFFNVYRKTYGEELDSERLGCTDAVHFLKSLGEKVLKIYCGPGGKTHISNMLIMPSRKLLDSQEKLSNMSIMPSKTLVNQQKNLPNMIMPSKILVNQQEKFSNMITPCKTLVNQQKKLPNMIMPSKPLVNQQEKCSNIIMPSKTLVNQQKNLPNMIMPSKPLVNQREKCSNMITPSKTLVNQQEKLPNMIIPSKMNQQKKLPNMTMPSKPVVKQQEKLQKAEKSSSVKHPEITRHFNAGEQFIKPTKDCGVRVKANLPEGLKEGDSIDVIVCEVASPSDFWIQLRGAANSWRLEELMEDMDLFYSDGERGRLCKLDQCCPGAIMAAPYMVYGYHRVCIREVYEDGVEAFFLDYGTIGFLQFSQLRLLHRRFSSLAAQALKAKLWRLTSLLEEDTWPLESIKRFFELVKPASGAGGCVSIVKEVRDGVLHLELFDTVTNDRLEGININQELVNEGLAVGEDGARPSLTTTDECSGNNIKEQEKTDDLTVCGDVSKDVDINVNVQNGLPCPTSQIVQSGPMVEFDKTNTVPHSPLASREKDKVKGNFNDINFDGGVPWVGNSTIDSVERTKFDKETTMSASKCPTSCILPLHLHNSNVHIIKYKGQAWMSSFQISSLIPNWKGLDLLDKMADLKRIPLEVEVVTSDQCDLYSELLGAGIAPQKDRRTEEDKFLLYLLKCVPHLLNQLSNEKNKELLMTIQTAIKQFC